MDEHDYDGALGDLADAIGRALDEAVEVGVPEAAAIAHLETLSRTWRVE